MANRSSFRGESTNIAVENPVAGHPGHSGTTIASGRGITPYQHGRMSAGSPSSNARPAPSLQHIFDEIRRMSEEQKKIREDMRKMVHDIGKVGEECKKINDFLKLQQDSSFTIESSVHKVRSHIYYACVLMNACALKG